MTAKFLKLLALAFLVCWKTYEGHIDNSYLAWPETRGPSCVVSEVEKQEQFGTLKEAREFASNIEKDRKNWDVKIIKLVEVDR